MMFGIRFHRRQKDKNLGGADRAQTGDLVVANDALYQLSYCPKREGRFVGDARGLVNSNFSPKPIWGVIAKGSRYAPAEFRPMECGGRGSVSDRRHCFERRTHDGRRKLLKAVSPLRSATAFHKRNWHIREFATFRNYTHPFGAIGLSGTGCQPVILRGTKACV